jgi:transposase-like protein
MHPTEFGAVLDATRRMTLRQLQRLAKEADQQARRAEALAEIERQVGDQPPCPHCAHQRVIRWGMSESGLQRWRCRDCGRTFNSAHGTGLARTKKRDTMLAFIRNMLMPSPLSCREAAKEFGIDKMTAWRWRMKICTAIEGFGTERLSGVVEADETFQRESRKGSREWVNHEEDPINNPRPPRLQWYEYKKNELPMKRGLSRWQVPIMTIMDRNGGRRADILKGLHYKHVGPVLTEHVAPDSVLCSDKAQGYKKFAAANDVNHVAVKARKGERVRDTTFHIQNVNALHGRFKDFVRDFDGPAKKHLTRYVAWFLFCDQHRQNPQAASMLLREVLGPA